VSPRASSRSVPTSAANRFPAQRPRPVSGFSSMVRSRHAHVNAATSAVAWVTPGGGARRLEVPATVTVKAGPRQRSWMSCRTNLSPATVPP
jgi:hypothetical protein